MGRLPYTNFHDMNLDWVLKQIKKAFTPDNPPPYPVKSVNGQTGNVTVTGDTIPIAPHNPEKVTDVLREKQDAPASPGTPGQVLGLGPNQTPVWMNQSGGVTSYDELTGKPSVNGVPLSGEMEGIDLGLIDAPSVPGTAGQVLTSDGQGGQSWQTVINDNAVGGDTDQTWSADKITQEIGTVVDGLNDKIDKPETQGTAGQVLSLDNNLDPVWTTPQGSGAVDDVQVNGTSVVVNKIANVPAGDYNTMGVVQLDGQNERGLQILNGKLTILPASLSDIKANWGTYRVLTPRAQHQATFYGLATAAGDTTQKTSSNAVGNYTENAKSSISEMLNGAISVSGTTPSITAKPGLHYICGEVSTLSIVVPESGIIDVLFESGTIATVLTVTPTKTGVTSIEWADNFEPTAIAPNAAYLLRIINGKYGIATVWGV